MTDTQMAEGTRHPRLRRASRPSSVFAVRFLGALFIASLLCLGALVERAAAQPVPLDARVAWARGQRAYVASHDSLRLAPLSLLTFTLKGKAVATGEVERLVDGAMAIARITSGSLGKVKDLDRLRILAERPRGPRVLRIGYPSEKRSPLLFACDRVRFDPPLPPASYRFQGGSGEDSAYRLMPLPDLARQVPWPETLVVRLFDDAADQEIAAERGELDVAVFRPGELSVHMRDHPRWKDRLSAMPARGLIGSIRWPADSTESRCATARREARAFGALDQALFRGDLIVWGKGDSTEWCGDSPEARSADRVRYEVDSSCPGRAAIERFLNRDASAGSAGDPVPVVRLFNVDSRPYHGREMVFAATEHIRRGSYPSALRAQADSLEAIIRRQDQINDAPAPGWPTDLARERLGLTFPISPNWQVLCESRFLPYVSALGAKAFVDLFDCAGPDRKP